MNSNGKVRLGFVGAGFISQVGHMINYWQNDQCEMYALAEFRPKIRELVARRFDISKTYESHEDLIQDPDVDAVVVVTRRQNTGPIALECLRAGKNTFTEKPIAADVQQGQKLVAMAHEKNVIYSVGYMRRHDEGVQTAKRLLDELRETRELGDIIFLRAHCFNGEAFCKVDGAPPRPGPPRLAAGPRVDTQGQSRPVCRLQQRLRA